MFAILEFVWEIENLGKPLWKPIFPPNGCRDMSWLALLMSLVSDAISGASSLLFSIAFFF